MARIQKEKMKRVCKERNTVHELVNATYDVFEIDEERYFQIDTFGRSSRENPGKISQSIQIDKTTAEYLVQLLEDTFELE